jgi:hypothetical protein
MALRRVATEPEQCKDGYTCPGIWVDDDPDIDQVVIVGKDLDPSPVPLGPGERAIRIRRKMLRNVDLSAFKDAYTCLGASASDDPTNVDEVVIVGEDLDPSPVPLDAGERAIRIRRKIVQNANP